MSIFGDLFKPNIGPTYICGVGWRYTESDHQQVEEYRKRGGPANMFTQYKEIRDYHGF